MASKAIKTAFDAEAKTPSSLSSTPRGSVDDCHCPLGNEAASPLNSGPDTSALCLQDAWASVRHMRHDADNLHTVLRIVRSNLNAVQSELVGAKLDIVRERQAGDIRVMEKECELKFLQSETEAYRLACVARTSAIDAMQATISSLQQELGKGAQEQAASASKLQESIAELDTACGKIKTLEARVSTLQGELVDARNTIAALEECKTQSDALGPQLEVAQADASTAAGQLMEACEENARLAEELAALEIQSESWHARAHEWARREEELCSRVDGLAAENARLRSELEARKNRVLREQQLTEFGVQDFAPPHLNKSMMGFLSPQPALDFSATSSAVTRSGADPEDLMAVEVSRLRRHAEELEAELAASGDSVPIIAALEHEAAALRTENAILRDSADRSSLEAGRAREDLVQVQQEAMALHGQLSDVISTLTSGTTGGAGGPPVIYTASASDTGNSRSITKDALSVGPALPSSAATPPEMAASTSAKGPSAVRHPWRGPPTPTSDIPPSTNVCRVQTAESDSGSSDQILLELRSAMASLDPINSPAPVLDRPASSSSCLVGEFSSASMGSEDAGRSENGQRRSTARMLESISRSIASLGQVQTEAVPHKRGGRSILMTDDVFSDL